MINTLPKSLIEAAKNIIGNKIYYRGTDNPKEQYLINTETIRPSINHVTGKPEIGLSVSDVPSISKYFRYMYSLHGDEVGIGSDGEPLLSLGSIEFIEWIKAPDQSLIGTARKMLMESQHPKIDDDSGIEKSHIKLNWAIGKDIDKAQAPYRQKNNKIVWLNAEEVLPKVHPDFRVIPESGMNHIGNRMDKAKSHFASGGYMDPPDVGYNAQHPKYPVGIGNGRHRIAAALSMGEKWFPASVEPDDVAQLKKHVSVMEKKPA